MKFGILRFKQRVDTGITFWSLSIRLKFCSARSLLRTSTGLSSKFITWNNSYILTYVHTRTHARTKLYRYFIEAFLRTSFGIQYVYVQPMKVLLRQNLNFTQCDRSVTFHEKQTISIFINLDWKFFPVFEVCLVWRV